MDNNLMRLEVVGGFAHRVVAANGSPFKVFLSKYQRESMTGASYVITQMLVGMMPARVAVL